MANLDDLFRSSQRTVRPATPPTGQWEQIISQVNAVPSPPRRGGFLGGLLIGLLAGLGFGVALLYYRGEPDCTGNFVEALAPAAAPPAVTVVTETVHDTVRIVEYLPAKLEPMNWSLADFSAAQLIQEKLATPRDDVRWGKKPMADFTKIIDSRFWNGGVSSVHPEDTIDLLAVRGFKPLPVKVETVTPNLGWKGFTRVGKSEHPAGRWEVGVHFTPELTNGEVYGRTLNRTMGPNGQKEIYNIDGREVTLYNMNNSMDAPLRVRPRIEMVHVQTARQFSNGLRVGLGFGYEHQAAALPKGSAIRDVLSEGQYLVYTRDESKKYLGTIQVGYTFWRRQRLQVGLGLITGGYFRNDDLNPQYIYSVDERRHYSIGKSSRTRQSGTSFYKWTVLPQMTVHYHLNDRLSVGAEIVPGLGLGARYKFY